MVSHATARVRPRHQGATTLWDEGRVPGHRVAVLTTLAAVGVAWLNVALAARLSLFFDLTFVVLCLVAALAVRPLDLFVVGVLPPLLMLVVVVMLALTVPGTVADVGDGLVQAVVSGLAHRASGLVAGYAVALTMLALRQLALRQRDARPIPVRDPTRSRPAPTEPSPGTDPALETGPRVRDFA
jgi:lysylphosphatidylglycerol synthetase-like protein (DUF2156 family)